MHYYAIFTLQGMLILLIVASTDVERVFTRGTLTLSKHCHSLNDESVCTASVLSMWAAIPNISPEQKIIKMFKNKSRRTKKSSMANVYADEDEACPDCNITIIDD